MTGDEVSARLIVLEVFSTLALGILLANAPNDSDFSKARALLDHVRQTVAGSRFQSEAEKSAAMTYVESLLRQAAENLPQMRGQPGTRH